MKTSKLPTFLTAILLALSLVSPVFAQDTTPSLEISLTRDFGYGGLGNDIQGTFTIKVSGPDTLQEVQFFMDDTLLGADSEPPYALQFNTDNFSPGTHTLYAIGILSDGSQIQSRELINDFLSAEDSMNKTLTIVIPIVAIALLGALLGTVVPSLMGKQGKQRPIGDYSLAGGTVCPRCKFPYSRHTFSPNLVFGKLERCPHCGKWSIRPRASQQALAEAEERLTLSRTQTSEVTVDPEDSLRKALDDSRYED